jgi:hypothetical protein
MNSYLLRWGSMVGILFASSLTLSATIVSSPNQISLDPGKTSDPAVIITSSKSNPLETDDTEEWVVNCGAAILGSITIADVDGNPGQEILVATYGIPPNPYWDGYLRVFDCRGNSLPGWPYEFFSPAPAAPAVGDLDEDRQAEIVAGSWQNLYVFEANGTVAFGWPVTAEITQTPALWDLDGDGDLEIIAACGQTMRVYHYDGTLLPGWPFTASQSLTSPAIADLNGDQIPEIVAATYEAAGSPTGQVFAWTIEGTVLPGFPFETNGCVKAPPAVGDVNGDGLPEIVFAAWNQLFGEQDPLYVLNASGHLLPGWPRAASYTRLSSPALGDLDGDGAAEIVIGGLATPEYWPEVFVFRGDGSFFTGWPVRIDISPAGNINSSPIIGDIDDDIAPEIIVKITNYIAAFDVNGTMLPNYPIFFDDHSSSGTYSPTPAVGDFDGDGDVELVAASCFSTIQYWDFDATYDPQSALWTQYRHDSLKTGNAEPDSIVSSVKQPPQAQSESYRTSISIFPNPASSGVNILMPSGLHGSTQGVLYNILARKVISLTGAINQGGAVNFSWKHADLAPGTYFLKLNAQQQVFFQRLLILP